MNKSAQVKPREWVLATGIFILIMSMGTWVVTNALKESPDNIDSEVFSAYNESFNKYDEYLANVEQLATDTEAVSGSNTGNFGFLNDIINQAWNILTQLRLTFDFMNSALEGLSSVLGVPPFITGLGISIITVIFIFAMLAVIFNRDL